MVCDTMEEARKVAFGGSERRRVTTLLLYTSHTVSVSGRVANCFTAVHNTYTILQVNVRTLAVPNCNDFVSSNLS